MIDLENTVRKIVDYWQECYALAQRMTIEVTYRLPEGNENQLKYCRSNTSNEDLRLLFRTFNRCT